MTADEAATWKHSGNNFTFITIHVESSTSVHFPVLPFYIVPFGNAIFTYHGKLEPISSLNQRSFTNR